MADQDSIWYRLGYTLERARGGSSPRSPRLRSLGEREWEDAEEEQEPRRAARKVGARRRPRPEPARSRAPEAVIDDDEVSDEELAAAIAAQGGELAEPEERGEENGKGKDPLETLKSFLKGASPTGEPWETVIAAVGTALVGRVLESMPRKRRPSMTRLLHAAAAGAGAALVREALRPVLTGKPEEKSFAQRARGAALSGGARGLLYGGLVEPRIPGPPLVRGAIYGAVEHVATPMGGLVKLAGARAPHRHLPFLSDLFEDLEPSDESLMEHVLFGIGMAALYGARPADAVEKDEDEKEEEEEGD